MQEDWTEVLLLNFNKSHNACGLIMFLLNLFLFRNNKMDYSISIHASLSGALFLLNSTFLLTEWGARMKPDWVCELVAALMHYSLLCCFTWMAIEALHLYLLLIKVFNTYYKHYLLKLFLAGWGEWCSANGVYGPVWVLCRAENKFM